MREADLPHPHRGLEAGEYTDGVQLILKGRGVDLNDRLREYASAKLTKSQRFFDRIIKIEAELSEERNARVKPHYRCEVTVKTPRETMRAHGAGVDYFAAIDQASERLDRQVRKHKDRLTNHGHRVDNHVESSESSPTEDGLASQIVRTRQTLVKPMSPEEAVLALETQAMQFLLFTSAETLEPSVIYRRSDGGYGLIDSTR